MITFFTSAEVTLGTKLLEVMFIAIGLMCLYCGLRNLRDKGNPSPIGTAVFWVLLFVLMAFGRWIPPKVCGCIVLVMVLPSILRKVNRGNIEAPSADYVKTQAQRIGMKIFVPAFSIGVFAIAFALFTTLGALVGVGAGIVFAGLALMVLNTDNKPAIFLQDSCRLFDLIGPLCLLPMLLAGLGAVFASAGVGEVIGVLVGKVVPEGSRVAGIIMLCVGMALFTAIMGNAFAAITVMMAGIGIPFVIANGADPVFVGSLALTSGYAGTLLTPMAANFNIVPVALLEIKDKYGVIKQQIAIAAFMLVFHICYMILCS